MCEHYLFALQDSGNGNEDDGCFAGGVHYKSISRVVSMPDGKLFICGGALLSPGHLKLCGYTINKSETECCVPDDGPLYSPVFIGVIKMTKLGLGHFKSVELFNVFQLYLNFELFECNSVKHLLVNDQLPFDVCERVNIIYKDVVSNRLFLEYMDADKVMDMQNEAQKLYNKQLACSKLINSTDEKYDRYVALVPAVGTLPTLTNENESDQRITASVKNKKTVVYEKRVVDKPSKKNSKSLETFKLLPFKSSVKKSLLTSKYSDDSEKFFKQLAMNVKTGKKIEFAKDFSIQIDKLKEKYKSSESDNSTNILECLMGSGEEPESVTNDILGKPSTNFKNNSTGDDSSLVTYKRKCPVTVVTEIKHESSTQKKFVAEKLSSCSEKLQASNSDSRESHQNSFGKNTSKTCCDSKKTVYNLDVARLFDIGKLCEDSILSKTDCEPNSLLKHTNSSGLIISEARKFGLEGLTKESDKIGTSNKITLNDDCKSEEIASSDGNSFINSNHRLSDVITEQDDNTSSNYSCGVDRSNNVKKVNANNKAKIKKSDPALSMVGKSNHVICTDSVKFRANQNTADENAQNIKTQRSFSVIPVESFDNIAESTVEINRRKICLKNTAAIEVEGAFSHEKLFEENMPAVERGPSNSEDTFRISTYYLESPDSILSSQKNAEVRNEFEDNPSAEIIETPSCKKLCEKIKSVALKNDNDCQKSLLATRKFVKIPLDQNHDKSISKEEIRKMITAVLGSKKLLSFSENSETASSLTSVLENKHLSPTRSRDDNTGNKDTKPEVNNDNSSDKQNSIKLNSIKKVYKKKMQSSHTCIRSVGSLTDTPEYIKNIIKNIAPKEQIIILKEPIPSVEKVYSSDLSIFNNVNFNFSPYEVVVKSDLAVKISDIPINHSNIPNHVKDAMKGCDNISKVLLIKEFHKTEEQIKGSLEFPSTINSSVECNTIDSGISKDSVSYNKESTLEFNNHQLSYSYLEQNNRDSSSQVDSDLCSSNLTEVPLNDQSLPDSVKKIIRDKSSDEVKVLLVKDRSVLNDMRTKESSEMGDALCKLIKSVAPQPPSKVIYLKNTGVTDSSQKKDSGSCGASSKPETRKKLPCFCQCKPVPNFERMTKRSLIHLPDAYREMADLFLSQRAQIRKLRHTVSRYKMLRLKDKNRPIKIKCDDLILELKKHMKPEAYEIVVPTLFQSFNRTKEKGMRYNDNLKEICCKIVMLSGWKAYKYLSNFFYLPNKRTLLKYLSNKLKGCQSNKYSDDNVSLLQNLQNSDGMDVDDPNLTDDSDIECHPSNFDRVSDSEIFTVSSSPAKEPRTVIICKEPSGKNKKRKITETEEALLSFTQNFTRLPYKVADGAGFHSYSKVSRSPMNKGKSKAEMFNPENTSFMDGNYYQKQLSDVLDGFVSVKNITDIMKERTFKKAMVEKVKKPILIQSVVNSNGEVDNREISIKKATMNSTHEMESYVFDNVETCQRTPINKNEVMELKDDAFYSDQLEIERVHSDEQTANSSDEYIMDDEEEAIENVSTYFDYENFSDNDENVSKSTEDLECQLDEDMDLVVGSFIEI